MSQIGNRTFKGTGDIFLYVEDESSNSSSVGMDGATGSFCVNVDNAINTSPDTATAQIVINPAANSNVQVNPNGTGALELVSGNLSMPATTASTNGVIEFGGVRMMHQYTNGGAGVSNLFMGYNAGNFTNTGGAMPRNIGIGGETLIDLTTGILNTAVGYSSAWQLTSGSNNTAVGMDSLGKLAAAATTGSANTSIGMQSMTDVTSGSNNVSVGAWSSTNLTTGAYNVAVGTGINGGGEGALSRLTTGNYNIALGSTPGIASSGPGYNYTGAESSNIVLGGATLGTTGESNTMRLGATGSGAGQVSRAFVGGTYGVTPAGATQVVVMDSAGQMGTSATAPSPASACKFAAKLTTPVSDVTGDGTAYTIICETERFDTGSNYNNATGVFTAPNTGTYQFSWGIVAQQFTSAFTLMNILLVTTGGSWTLANVNPGTMFQSANNLGMSGSLFVDMSATDTAFLRIAISGSTKTIDLFGDATTNTYTYFSGYQVS